MPIESRSKSIKQERFQSQSTAFQVKKEIEEKVKIKSEIKSEKANEGEPKQEKIKMKIEVKNEKLQQATTLQIKTEMKEEKVDIKSEIKSEKSSENEESRVCKPEKQFDENGDPFWMLGRNRRLTMSKYKGNEYVHIRKYFNNENGEARPTKAGITLNKQEWMKMMSVQNQVNFKE